MKIKFLDLNKNIKQNKSEIILKIDNLLKNQKFILGDEVLKFEKNWANFCNSKYCISTNSGLDALTISLKALNLNEGSEVIVPAHTFIATWQAVNNNNLKLIPVDIYSDSYNINADLIEKVITKKTKAIIFTHLYGQPADINKINKIKRKYNLTTIEDAAQAHGAKYHDKKIGSHSDMVIWSFYPGKNLGGVGDGGAITTNNLNLYKKSLKLRNYGSQRKYYHDLIGLNSRLSPINAIILNSKLKQLEQNNKKRKQIASIYSNLLNKEKITLPLTDSVKASSWHLFVIRVKKRLKLIEYLKKFGVETLIHYPIPPYKQKAYKNFNFDKNDYPITEKISKEILSLPIDPSLSISKIKYISKIINSFYK